jgi:hypothetical protein
VSTLARNEQREQLRYNYTPDELREKQAAEAQPDAPAGAIVPFTGAPGPKNVTPQNPPAAEDDELTWAAQLEAQRKQTAKEDAEKRKASKGRRTSSGGVVGTEADGKDLSDPDDKKNSN